MLQESNCFISDLKQELQVKERCPDNERMLNGFSAQQVDSNRLKVEHETQTTPLKRKIQKILQNIIIFCGSFK